MEEYLLNSERKRNQFNYTRYMYKESQQHHNNNEILYVQQQKGEPLNLIIII